MLQINIFSFDSGTLILRWNQLQRFRRTSMEYYRVNVCGRKYNASPTSVFQIYRAGCGDHTFLNNAGYKETLFYIYVIITMCVCNIVMLSTIG